MIIRNISKGEEAAAAELLGNRTEEDFEAVDRTVKEIIADVRANGDEAIYRYNRKFSGWDGTDLRVSEEEIREAMDAVEPEMMEALKLAAANIREFHQKQLAETWTYERKPGVTLGQLIRPIQNIGVTVPGGATPLFSTVLMDIIPAKIAGCPRVVMCTPPDAEGKINKYVLTAAHMAGADEIYKVGGAQGIAAMAAGTRSIAKVNKIVGPGGVYVARAKKQVFGTVAIDMIAGPSEVCVIADSSADPSFAAADMLSQAEHDPASSAVLITPDGDFAKAVEQEIYRQLEKLSREKITEQSINNNGAIFITEDMESAFALANEIAPEHLELAVEQPEQWLSHVQCAGAVLLGHWSSEPLGDYAAGPNHTLPTSGTAKFANPLGVYDFQTRSSIINYSREGLAEVKDAIIRMADHENLTAHGNAIRIRFDKES
ncbi:MAG: histidinol dehydrogenase [Anaerovoracaceae bacterium]